MRISRLLSSLPLLAMLAASPAAAADSAAAKTTASATHDSQDQVAMLPPARTVKQSAVIGGRRIDYQATVGALPVKDEKGKVTGEVVYTAYVVPGREDRPVTFVMNGGPGAASAFLTFGGIGPHRLYSNLPSDDPAPRDNPDSWLDLTDLVFIDPIGTGFSRSHVDEAETKKDFFTPDTDIHYLSRVIYDWLARNDRMMSRKYLVGESYGGYRVPRIANYLQQTLGVGLSGITMISPALDMPALTSKDTISPFHWMISLPAMAAGYMERQGKPVDAASMAPVLDYARTQFLQDFMAGAADKAATDRLSARVAELTGLDPALVRRLDGRIDLTTYLREAHRAQGLIGSVYDSNVTALDPFPSSATENVMDPELSQSAALYTQAMVDFDEHVMGWRPDSRYILNNFDVNSAFERDHGDSSVIDLRQAMAADPHLKILIVHGWNDFACPYLTSRLVLDQMPASLVNGRVTLTAHPGGHTFYNRPASGTAFHQDAATLYAQR